MTVYQYLNSLDQSGELRKLIRAGIVSIDYAGKIDIYRAFDAESKRPGFKKNYIIDSVCNQFNISPRTVERVVVEMNREFVF